MDNVPLARISYGSATPFLPPDDSGVETANLKHEEIRARDP